MTVRLLADENIAPAVILGRKRRVAVDIVRVQDVGLRSQDDPIILQWAADNGRILLSHDLRTIPDFAFERIARGQAMPGVFVASSTLAIAVLLNDLTLIIEASSAEDWINQIVYLPLR